ncbi:chloride channel protein [Thermodesulfobacterium thermophilum]|uniref:chloride channel protein n=1 Tax=Thermodesulfobacterium thermophilum TaxID=886 RepID=UPI0003B76136|nr:chloride channel protein [Thermodesulfobacterium thermophilum]
MREKLLELSILFISVIKWVFFAVCIGILVGVSTTVFLKSLDFGISLAQKLPYYYLLLPLALLVSTLIIHYLAPQAKGHGTEKVIEAVHKFSGKINPLVVPIKLVATIITISFGGSAGKEGPAAQIGAGLCSIFSDLLRFNESDRKKLVICGISAGFATVFGTPIAGAIFGVEVLFVGTMLYDVLLPSFVAGIIGYHVSSSLGITYFHEPLKVVPTFTSLFFITVCFSGIFFGLISLLFIETFRFFEKISKNSKLNLFSKPIIGGLILIVLTFIFSENYLGLGLETIKKAIEGEHISPIAFMLKILFTSITLNFGGSGGVVTPLFFVGATAGNTFGILFGLDRSLFASIGMVSLLAGAANTPIAASIMAVELFGPQIAPYAALACIISFLITGHRSIYPSQVLAMAKSTSLSIEKGKELREIIEIIYQPRPKSLSAILFQLIKKFFNRS